MSESERRLADTTGRFLRIPGDEAEAGNPRWVNGRVLLSNRRLILVGTGGKRTVPLSSIGSIKGRIDVTRAVAGVSNYTTLRIDGEALLLSAKDHREFELDLCTALLSEERVLVRHPAVEGGVVQESEWERAHVKPGGDEVINLTSSKGSFVPVALDDVGKVSIADRTVEERFRKVIEVEHSEGGTSVETHVAGNARCCSVLKVVFERGVEQNSGAVELDEEQKQVLMALYSGVSPFEIPEFTGVDVDAVEETYERLIEVDVLSEVRKRREVELTPRGRNLASEAISEE